MNYIDNDKRFTVKLLGVFQMDAQNFTPNETRKTLRHIALWIMAVMVLAKLLGWLNIYIQSRAA